MNSTTIKDIKARYLRRRAKFCNRTGLANKVPSSVLFLYLIKTLSKVTEIRIKKPTNLHPSACIRLWNIIIQLCSHHMTGDTRRRTTRWLKKKSQTVSEQMTKTTQVVKNVLDKIIKEETSYKIIPVTPMYIPRQNGKGKNTEHISFCCF